VILQNEVDRAKHNVGLALLEKAKNFVKYKRYLESNYFAYLALKNMGKKYDNSFSRDKAKNILITKQVIGLGYRKLKVGSPIILLILLFLPKFLT